MDNIDVGIYVRISEGGPGKTQTITERSNNFMKRVINPDEDPLSTKTVFKEVDLDAQYKEK